MPPPKQDDNMMVTLGRLLEAAEGTNVHLDKLQAAVQESSTVAQSALQTVGLLRQTVETVQMTVTELDKLVRGSKDGDSLVTLMTLARNEQRQFREERSEASKEMLSLSTRISALEQKAHESNGRNYILWIVLGMLAWSMTTGIALYAALGQWAAARGAKP